MLFPEEDAPELKAWIVKRIENTSDADSDVLADYVIALLKHDGDKESVRKLCEQEIPDFLTEDSKAFLDDVFRVVEHRSYKPGAPPPPKFDAPTEHIPDPMVNSRKRVRYDDLDMEDHDMQGGNRGRAFKQARRAGRGGGQGQNMQMPPGMPAFDPNNPMETFMRMQAMGIGMPAQFNQKPKRRGRCRDFDTKGFCSRGSTCPYDHGSESAWVPPFQAQGEYDPEDPMKNMPMFNPMMAYNFPPENNRGRNRRGRGGRKGNNRANLSAEGPNHDRSKTTIVVENIPQENLNEDSVREFFTQFGSIAEISIKTQKRLAVIKFDAWDSANAAYQSPKVVFDNRFVKVFWHKDEAPRNNSKQDAEPEIDHEEFARRQEEAQKQHMEREAKRLEIEQQRQQLEEQQQKLLAKHREETERLRAKMSGSNGSATPTEEGSTNDMLRAKLAELENEAKILGLNPDDEAPARGGYRGRGRGFRGRYAPRGRGSFRGTGRHATYAQYSIDNRPKKVAISGVDFTAPDKNEALRHFLLNTGEFESMDTAAEVTHVAFQDRKTAEKFYYTLHGKELPGVEGQLDLAWVSGPAAVPEKDAGDKDVGDATAGMDAKEEVTKERREVDMDYEMPDEEQY